MKDGEKCALMLLKSGAGPNLTTEEGQTPVHVAARYGNLQTLLLLLEDGGDPQFQNHVRKFKLFVCFFLTKAIFQRFQSTILFIVCI